jgi:hypothetical protein
MGRQRRCEEMGTMYRAPTGENGAAVCKRRNRRKQIPHPSPGARGFGMTGGEERNDSQP